MAAFADQYRGFEMTVAQAGAGYTGEVRPIAPDAEKAIHGFRMTRASLHGKSLEDAARLFFSDTRQMLDKLLPPA